MEETLKNWVSFNSMQANYHNQGLNLKASKSWISLSKQAVSTKSGTIRSALSCPVALMRYADTTHPSGLSGTNVGGESSKTVQCWDLPSTAGLPANTHLEPVYGPLHPLCQSIRGMNQKDPLV